jgi:hypothetical protein
MSLVLHDKLCESNSMENLDLVNNFSFVDQWMAQQLSKYMWWTTSNVTSCVNSCLKHPIRNIAWELICNCTRCSRIHVWFDCEKKKSVAKISLRYSRSRSIIHLFDFINIHREKDYIRQSSLTGRLSWFLGNNMKLASCGQNFVCQRIEHEKQSKMISTSCFVIYFRQWWIVWCLLIRRHWNRSLRCAS